MLHLAERLEAPVRERNGLRLAAGYAPTYAERSLDDPEMAPARSALDRFLAHTSRIPRSSSTAAWNIAASNAAIALLLDGVTPHLLEPPANALRITLHPAGLAPRIVNLAEWSGHLLAPPGSAGGDHGRR